MDHRKYTEENRTAWNAAADQHKEMRWDIVLEQLSDPADSPFEQVALDHFADIGLTGKDVIQLCCNNGREVLSLKKLGAGRCVGVDISDKFVQQGRDLATASGLEGEFIRADVMDLPAELEGEFDMVLITIGALNWIPDIKALFRSCAKLLRAGGHLFIHEMHPMLWMLEPDRGTELLYSYFMVDAFSEDTPLNYYGGEDYDAPMSHAFQATLGDIIGAILDAGLTLSHFQEYAKDISNNFPHLENQKAQLPLSYTMIAEKADDGTAGSS
jgi:ubiquinone/menaquinone biosynthesis C-methylase UbiE